MFRGSRSAATKLAAGLRGYANSKKKAPDFYKPTSNSAEAAAPKPSAAQSAATSSVEGETAARTAAEAAKAAPSATPPAAAANPAPGVSPAAPQPAASSAAAAAKPEAPATPPVVSTATAPKPAGAGAAATAAAAPATPVATSAAPKPAAAHATASPAASAASAASKPTRAAAAAPKPTPATGQGSVAGPAGGSAGGGNGWRLHPALPVDVRLLGAGLVGAGGLYYALQGGGGDAPAAQPAAQPGVVEEAGFSMRPEEPPPAAEAPAALAAEPEPAADAAAVTAGERQEEAAAADAGAGTQASKREEAGEAEEKEEVTYVDGSKVLGLIEEVFSKEAAEKVREAEEAAAAASAQAAAAAQHAAETVAAGAAEAAPRAKAAAGEARARASAEAAEAQRRAEERVAAVQAALADQAGEAVASDFVQSKRADAPSLSGLLQAGKQAAAAAAAEAPPPAAGAALRGPPAEDEVAGALAAAQKLLGIQVDVSGAGLVAEALKRGVAPSEDGGDSPQRHRQAEADAEVLAELLQAAAASVERQLAAARDEAAAGQAEAAAARRELARQAESFRVLLQDALARAEEQQRQQLRRQAEQLATAHAEMTVRERAERLAGLDGVRERLNALEQAFQRRSDEQRSSHTAHQLSVAASALRSALAAGAPLAPPLAYLAPLAAADAVVGAALAGVPAEAAERGAPSREQLADGFRDVQRLSRQLGMIPEGQGGVLALAVAKLAASLKIAERGPSALALPGEGMDRRLAVAQQRVLDGQLLGAAAELQAAAAGTAAAPLAADWARAVRSRVLAEQAAALLEAHAAAESASLA